MHAQEQINLYIADQAEWQRLLLIRLRQLIHSVDEKVEENWRLNRPHFDHDGIMVAIGAHKTFVSVWFHKGALMKDPHDLLEASEKDGEKGMRTYKLAEGDHINEKAFMGLMRQAVAVNQDGVKMLRTKPVKKALAVPPEFESCIKKDEQTLRNWERSNFTYKKKCMEWITDPKKEETRKRRMAQALEMIREGVGLTDKNRIS